MAWRLSPIFVDDMINIYWVVNMNKMAMILAVSLAFSSQAAFAQSGVVVNPELLNPVVATPVEVGGVVSPAGDYLLPILFGLGVAGVAAAASGGSSATPQHP